MSTKGIIRSLVFALCAAWCGREASGQIRITEYMYSGANGEFIELTNLGGSAVDLTGWSYDDNTRVPGSFSLSAFGSVAPGESVILTESAAEVFRAAWNLPAAVKIIGGSTQNLGRADEINIYNASNALVDRLTYDDQTIPGSIRTQNKSGWVCTEAIGVNNILKWFLSAAADQQGSFASTGGDIGSPGVFVSVACPNAPVVAGVAPARRTAVSELSSLSVTFSTGVTGVAAANLTVNGSVATSVSGSGAGPYLFSGFTTPAAGSTSIALASGAIVSQFGSIPFAGDSWTVSVGITIVINELNYHPKESLYPNQETEFLELYNAGPAPVDMSGWSFLNGITYTFPNGISISAGGYRVVAVNASALQAITGYAGALQWTSGALSNGGERVTIADASQNVIDSVNYSDSGEWPTAADGDGPSLELINPGYPNEYGGAWRASAATNGTPGAQNSSYQAALAPIVTGTQHTPIIPAANQAVTITAIVIDDSPNPVVTLYYRQDQDPTIAYTTTPMWDDGAHGDGAAGDKLYGAIVPGLADGDRLDFTIRADDGSHVTAAPPGHNTLAAGQYPVQTYLCKFSNAALPTDFPSYHLIVTQRTRYLQNNHIEDEFDATFVHCDTAGNCVNWYNATEHYRGASSLGQHPHSFRINLPDSPPFDSELGFRTTKINVLSQSVFKQYLGMQFFREAFGGSIPTPRSQFVRLNTNPLSHGGIQDFVYHNIEVLDGDFIESQNGEVSPLRFPDRCSGSLDPCTSAAICGVGESCVPTDDGGLYRGRYDGARLDYKGPNKDSYRTAADGTNGYQKYTNETEDNWDDLIALCFALDPATTPDSTYEASVSALVDEEEWAKWFAIHMILVNQEGGIYRDSGDDFFLYFARSTSPGGYNAMMLPWDMDSTFGGFGDSYYQESIWRTTTVSPQRFIRSNSYAGRFVKAICDMLDNEFTQANLDARIDALPAAVAETPRKQDLKNWVAARRAFVQNEIKTQLTIANLPASPYTNANPSISLNGLLNQCGTRFVRINGVDADAFSVYAATWSKTLTLRPGLNHITVQCLDHASIELNRIDATVDYEPPLVQPGLRLTVPPRMVDSKTLTLRADILDSAGDIDWHTCGQVGSISAARALDGSAVPISVTIFETFDAGAGAGGPAPGTIRFYNGVGSVSITLDQGAATPPGDIVITVTVGPYSASRIVQVLDGESPGLFKNLAGTLTGADLTWSPGNGVIHLTGDVTVDGGNTLTIEPGTLIMVDPGPVNNGTAINVQGGGAIHAPGSRSNPIFFFPTAGPLAMSLPQTTTNNDSSWRGIYHQDTGTSDYSFVFITGAGNAPISSHPRPPILRCLNSHNLLLQDCLLADCPGMGTFALGQSNGAYTFRRCLFSRVGIGAEWLGSGLTVTVEDCWFTRIGRAPEANDLDGDILHVDRPGNTYNIRRSILTDGGDDAIDHSTGAQPHVENCIIYDIRDKAVSIGPLSEGPTATLTMTNCLVFNAPNGIRCAGAPAHLTHCTLGSATNINGQGCTSSIQQSILWTNSAGTCCGAVDYSIVGAPADLGCGTGNLSVDPLFVNTSCNYSLQGGSPARTAGPGGTQIGWLGFPLPPGGCIDASDCDDANPCTIDSCENGMCVHTPIPNCCQSVSDCDDDNACTTDACVGGQCQHSAVDCDDHNACTVDACDPILGCTHTPINCDDGNPCTVDWCDPVNGCQHTPVTNGTPCPNGTLCDGDETCQNGVCMPGAPLACDDGLFCNGVESCDPQAGCIPGTPPCQSGEQCDELADRCRHPRMICQLRSDYAMAGSTVPLDIFLKDAMDVQSYQVTIAISRTLGTGTVSLACPGAVVIDENRPDYIFYSLGTTLAATDCANLRAASGLAGGSATVNRTAYLATYILSVSADASAGSAFEVAILPAPDSALTDSTSAAIPFTTPSACTLAIAPPTAGTATVNLEIPGLTGGPGVSDGQIVAERTVDFIATACLKSTDIRTLPVIFRRQGGSGVAQVIIGNLAPGARWISVREGHTLRRRVPIDLSGDLQDTVSVSLKSGDLQTASLPQDGLIDITDFAILAARWNTQVGECGGGNPEDCALGADVSGDGLQETVDFTAIQINFFEGSDPVDGCRSAGHGFVPIRESIDLDEISGRVPLATRADLNGDSVIDGSDIRAFARLHRLPLLPAFEAKLQKLEAAGPTQIRIRPAGE